MLCATARNFASRSNARLVRSFLPVAAGAARLIPALAHRRILERMLQRIEHPQLREKVIEEFAGHHPPTVIQAAGAVGGFSSHDWIGRVDVPTAVLVTLRDGMVPPARQAKLAESIPGAVRYDVDGDHDSCVNEPSFVTTLVGACRDVAKRAGLMDGARYPVADA